MAINIEHLIVEHSEGLFYALQDERIYEFLDEEPPNSVEAVRALIERRLRGAPASSGETWLNWTIFENETIVGYTQATMAEDGEASLAYVLSPSAWGRSVAYNACVLTIAELDASSSVKRIIADTEQGNTRSQTLLERLGFIRNHEDDNNVFYVR